MQYPIPTDLSAAGYVLAHDRNGDRAEHVAAVVLGRAGGQKTGGAKAAAARANGMLGGRPPGS